MLARSTGSVFAAAERVVEHDADTRVARAHVLAQLFGTADRERLGRYELHALIGEGAYGRVYEAFDPRLRRRVAIKVLRRDRAFAPLAARHARAAAEARGLARLQHPNVVAVYDAGVATSPSGERALYIVMELVEGPDLERWLEERPRAWSQILRIGLGAARGLAAAHRAGLVHRDVKPTNVLVGRGGVGKMADFGLVGRTPRVLSTADAGGGPEDDARLTASGQLLGTPLYMAPEQHEGASVDARADQYGLCVTLWEAFAHAPPFTGSTTTAVHAAKLDGPPKPPRRSPVPTEIFHALARGLAPRPDDRHRDVDALATALAASMPGRRRRVAIFGAALGVGALSWVAGAAAPDDCAQASASWRPAHEAAILAAFSKTGRTDADERAAFVGRELDAWHARWDEAAAAACGDPRARDSDACLQAAWDERSALLDVLAEADARAVGRAVTAIASLPAPGDCVHGRPRARPKARRDVSEALARVTALQAAGREREAWVQAQHLLSRLEPTDPAWPEAAFRVGRLEVLLGEGGAVATLERAHHEALAADDPRMAAAAGAQLLQLHARADDRIGAAMWDRHTEAALRRAGEPDDLRLVWLHGRGMLAQRTGRVQDAIAAYDEAVTVAERAGAAEQAATSLGMRGLAFRDAGDLQAAEADLRESLRRREALLGSDDVRLHPTLQNLGSVLASSGAHAEARAMLERALDLIARHRGPADREAVDVLELLGLLAQREGDDRRAALLLAEVLTARERDPGESPRKRAHACFNLANVEAVLGDLEAAARHHAEALRGLEEAVGPEHPEVAYVLAALADVERERGRLPEARGHLRRAEALLVGAEIPGARRAELAEIAAKMDAVEGSP